MYIHRIIEAKLNDLSEHFPIVIVCGARQVGRTTLLNRVKEKNSQTAKLRTAGCRFWCPPGLSSCFPPIPRTP